MIISATSPGHDMAEMKRREIVATLRQLALLICCSLLPACNYTPAANSARDNQERFDSPDAAVAALVAAVRSDQADAIVRMLGPGSGRLVYSGDAVADRTGRARFISIYDQDHGIKMEAANRAVLVIGDKHWPFPIPVVRSRGKWLFDTAAGEQEILNRRIGRNELNAIKVCAALVDAERDYAQRFRGKQGVMEYAQKFISSPDRYDGLYWPVEPGQPQSPIGPLLAEAHSEGYGVNHNTSGKHEPYHGYYYRIMKSQGGNAAGGAYDYVVDGHMIGGFALVAFPAKYGNSGIMTFMVNQDGVIYQNNLGPDTAAIAGTMQSFDPDRGWRKVKD